jgi:hypothetical protein
MKLFIGPRDERQTGEEFDMREEFDAFLPNHNVGREVTSTAKGEAIFLWDKGTTHDLASYCSSRGDSRR